MSSLWLSILVMLKVDTERYHDKLLNEKSRLPKNILYRNRFCQTCKGKEQQQPNTLKCFSVISEWKYVNYFLHIYLNFLKFYNEHITKFVFQNVIFFLQIKGIKAEYKIFRLYRRNRNESLHNHIPYSLLVVTLGYITQTLKRKGKPL